MCLIKKQKYQYLYLWHRVCVKSESIDKQEYMMGETCKYENERVIFYFKWLEKINKKYKLCLDHQLEIKF